MAICTEIVVYKTAAGFSVPAVLTAAYDSGDNVTTDKSDTVTGDLIVLGFDGTNTALTGVTKGTTAGTWAYLTAYSA